MRLISTSPCPKPRCCREPMRHVGTDRFHPHPHHGSTLVARRFRCGSCGRTITAEHKEA